MSYEGREQLICENGHFFQQGASYDFSSDDENICPFCKGKGVWRNCVDDTNVESYGEIPEEILQTWEIKPAEICTCGCGHTHIKSQALYRVPSKEETKKARHWFNGEKFVPCEEGD